VAAVPEDDGYEGDVAGIYGDYCGTAFEGQQGGFFKVATDTFLCGF
jgi:hypothetical protein